MKTIRIALAFALAPPALALSALAVPTPVLTEERRNVPRLGDIMTFIQIRHGKLWFAGNAQNWELAAYTLAEIQEGFDGVAKFHPRSNNVAMGPALNAHRGELAALGKAVEAKDRSRFRAGYDRLTASCNACHQVTRHAFIVIQRPKELPLTNQIYTPPSTRVPRPKPGR